MFEEYWDRQPCGSLRPSGNRYKVQPHIPPFADFFKWRGKQVLEIGCGIGEDAFHFAIGGARVVAVDTSNASLAMATKINDHPNIAYFSAIPSFCSFDLVYSFGVLHHTPNPEVVLHTSYMVLAQGGELRIMLYGKYSLKHFLGTQPEAQSGCPLVKWYSKRQARKLVESAGFRVVSIEKTHIFPYRIKDYIQGRYVIDWPWTWIPKEALEPYLGHHLLIRAVKA